MIRCSVIFLAVGLAAGFRHFGSHDDQNPPPPIWPSRYKVEGEIHHPLADVTETFTYWVDGKSSRQDTNGGVFKQYSIPYLFFLGLYYEISPITTDTELNKMTCLRIPKLKIGREGLLPDLASYTFVGKERLFGRDALKWQTSEEMGPSGMVIRNMWVAEEVDISGNSQLVPLRYEYQNIISVQQNKVYAYYHVDYFNYETTEIKPEIFEVPPDLNCDSPLKFRLTTEDHFNNFKAEHGRQYTEEEHEQRLRIFKHNLRNIEAHNRAGRGYKLAVNHLADRTPKEIGLRMGLRHHQGPVGGLPFPYVQEEIDQLSKSIPQEWDWRIHGAVTPVKNQLDCASCWAFATVGAVEGALKIHSGKPVERLSEQALVDCTWEKNYGCGGGFLNQSMDWIMKHGLPRYLDYGGYLGMNGLCHRNNITDAVYITGYVKVPKNEEALRLAVYKHGPVAVAVSTPFHFQFYSEGVYEDDYCDPENLSHGVVVVGYGVKDGKKYWLLKNSEGSGWGNGGYMLMSAKGNTCGILSEPFYATMD